MRYPAQSISIIWCPVCGRDDRVIPFTGKSHWSAGKKCAGMPVTVVYTMTGSEQVSVPDTEERSNRG
jgi:hypothetical protein